MDPRLTTTATLRSSAAATRRARLPRKRGRLTPKPQRWPVRRHGNTMGKNTGIDMVSDVVSINETSQVRTDENCIERWMNGGFLNP